MELNFDGGEISRSRFRVSAQPNASSCALHFILNRKCSLASHRKALGRGGDEERPESSLTDKRLKLFIQYLFRIQMVLRVL